METKYQQCGATALIFNLAKNLWKMTYIVLYDIHFK